jgi:hypothetical protein
MKPSTTLQGASVQLEDKPEWRSEAAAAKRKLPRNLPDLVDQRDRVARLQASSFPLSCFVCGTERASRSLILYLCKEGCEAVALELVDRQVWADAEGIAFEPTPSRQGPRRARISKPSRQAPAASSRPARRRGRSKR